jgi:CRP-like cAMP-binding protein
MTTAYEGALRVLGLANRTDPITEIVAKKIIEIAQTGERDPLRIRARAIADLGIPSIDQDQPRDCDQEEALMNNAPVLGRWGNRLLAALPRETLAMLERDLKQVSLSQGALCFDVGDQIDRVYFPATGMISLLIATKDGNVVEAGAIGRGGAAGLQSALGERRSYTRATIQIPGTFTTISAVDFRRAASHNGVIRDLASRYTEVSWAESQQTAACNAIHDGSQRLCRWLLQSADCIGSDHLLLTQEYLADMLGVRRTTVTLLAQELQERGAIRYSRGKIMILDRKGLEARACECYEAIKHENLSLRIGVKF